VSYKRFLKPDLFK